MTPEIAQIFDEFNRECEALLGQAGGQCPVADEHFNGELKICGKKATQLRFLKKLAWLSNISVKEVVKKIIKRGIAKEFEVQHKNAIEAGKYI